MLPYVLGAVFYSPFYYLLLHYLKKFVYLNHCLQYCYILIQQLVISASLQGLFAFLVGVKVLLCKSLCSVEFLFVNILLLLFGRLCSLWSALEPSMLFYIVK